MEFRLNGGSYARKGGNNSNDGLTQNTPKATISAAIGVGTGDVVVLSGVYTEAPSLSRRILCDGVVRMIAPSINVTNLSLFSAVGLQIEGFNAVTLGNNTVFSFCTFMCKSIVASAGAYNMPMSYCRIIGAAGASRLKQIDNCILFGVTSEAMSTDGQNGNNKNYVAFDCVLTSVSAVWKNNCIQGIIRIGTTNYVVPQYIDMQADGFTPVAFSSRQGVYPAGAQDWLHVGLGQTAQACYQTNGNFNADPQFLDVANYDFTVAPTSPLLTRNMCGVVAGTRVNASAFSKQNLSGTNDLTVESPHPSGFATSPAITIDPVNARTLGRIQYVGAMNFDALAAGGTATNDNVPKTATYTKNGQSVTSTSPRPSVMIRWSTRTDRAPDANTDGDWGNENVNGVLPGEWVLAELNTDFLVDSKGWGNGDERFNPLAAQAIQATYYQIRVNLLDTYNYG